MMVVTSGVCLFSFHKDVDRDNTGSKCFVNGIVVELFHKTRVVVAWQNECVWVDEPFRE